MATKEKEVTLFGDKENLPTEATAPVVVGNENVSVEDMALPYISVLQALSPQVEEIEGAKAGMFFNSITQEVSESLDVLNLYFTKSFAIFKKRNLGGGFNGSATTRTEAEEMRAALPGDASDYDVVETHSHTILILDENGKGQPAIFNLSGSKLTPSRNWNTLISQQDSTARFGAIYRLSTVTQSNAKGSWKNLNIVKVRELADDDAELFGLAEQIYRGLAASQG